MAINDWLTRRLRGMRVSGRARRAGVAAAGLAGIMVLAMAPEAGASTPSAATATAMAAAAPVPVCPGVTAPAVPAATPDTTLDTLFDNYANHGQGEDHWTGADSTFSARLPGGRELWIFSDTFLGTITPQDTRSPVIGGGGTTPFIHNSFVEQKGVHLSTLYGGTAANPTSLVSAPDASHWYWAGDAIADGDVLEAIDQEYKLTGSGAFDFAWDRNVLALYSVRDLSHPFAVKQLPSAGDIAWGSWIMRDGRYTYIYGVEDLGANKYMHVARVAGDNLLAPWRYYTADGTWSASESESARIAEPAASDGSVHVDNEYSVTKMGRLYVLVTQNSQVAFSPQIDVLFSCSPTGPFTDRTPVYDTPETGPYGSYQNANVFTYNAHAHPEISAPGHLVISYNVNSLVSTDLYSNASIYRPRFIELTIGS
jgi:hypothetical protein